MENSPSPLGSRLEAGGIYGCAEATGLEVEVAAALMEGQAAPEGRWGVAAVMGQLVHVA